MKIAPSIIAADLGILKEELSKIKTADYVHVDIMDGHFVPNITIGLPVCKAIKKYSALPQFIHLMISSPSKFIDKFAEYADILAIHYSINENIPQILKHIRELGCKAGLTISPKVEVGEIAELLPLVDVVTVMTVEPGFSGQKLIESVLPKFKQLRDLQSKTLKFEIAVDGGINLESIKKVDCDIAVAGSYIFNSNNYADAIGNLRAQSTLDDFIKDVKEK